jgi:histidine triad (HIT) family protein
MVKMADDCIFCKIVREEIPSSKVYEDKEILAFLDIMPVNKGHALVIPKQHFETLMDVPDDLLQKMVVALKKVSAAVLKGAGADGVSIAMSNYAAAGQVVPHAHMHVIPRLSSDGLKLWPQHKYDEGEIDSYAEKIKKAL